MDWLTDAPLDDPLSYPGLIPPFSYVLTGSAGDRVNFAPIAPAQEIALVTGVAARGRAVPWRAVLAVGSNAAPAQLVRKFGAGGLARPLAVLRVSVGGLCILPSAHLSLAGYLPFAPADARTCADSAVTTSSGGPPAGVDPLPAIAIEAHLLLLDDARLARLDETEPNYRRVALDPLRHPVRTVSDGSPVSGVEVYASRHGVITDERLLRGQPAPAVAQHVLIERLIAALWPDAEPVPDAAGFAHAVRRGELSAAAVTGLIKQRLRHLPAGAFPV